MHVRTDRYGKTDIHLRVDDVAHSPEQKINDALAHKGVVNREFTMRVRDLLAKHSSLSISEAVEVILEGVR